MTGSPAEHLASCPCTVAGSRALIFHLRDDHGKTLFTSPYEEDHAVPSAMHAAAHEAEPCEPLCTCKDFHRPHPHHGPAASAGAEPAGDGTTGSAPARSTARTPPTAAAAARPRPGRRSA